FPDWVSRQSILFCKYFLWNVLFGLDIQIGYQVCVDSCKRLWDLPEVDLYKRIDSKGKYKKVEIHS
ncbi:MAG: hypothetical protein PHR67_00905, partial [Candidatus Cloacimonetes bacterium]|nr:hypothetical protein [Candidatus Cloacimonadota bacterium]